MEKKGKQKKTKVVIEWGNERQLNAFKILVRSFYDYQRERMALDGRIGLRKDGTTKDGVPERDDLILAALLTRRADVFEMEEDLRKQLSAWVHTHPLWKAFLKHAKGCGETIAAVLLSEVDIHKAEAVSNLWSFSGLAPGKDKKKKGTVKKDGSKGVPFNQFLKAKLCGVLGSCFLQSQSPYSQFYYNEKTRLENSDVLVPEIKEKGGKVEMVAWKDAKKDHRHKAAIRKMIKEFLKDVYVAWRQLENLPVRKPYVEEYLGKVHGVSLDKGWETDQVRQEIRA